MNALDEYLMANYRTTQPQTPLCPGALNPKPCVQVVYFTDALDEYLMANMPEYDDIKFQDVTKDDLKIGKDKAEKKREKKVKVRALVGVGAAGLSNST